MADASLDSHYEPTQTPDLVAWTDDAHCLYLRCLEETFVNHLYQRQYCADDICGSMPPNHTCCATAEASPSTLQSQESCPSIIKPKDSKPNLRCKMDPRLGLGRKWSLSGANTNLSKRKRTCFSVSDSLDGQHGILVPSKVPEPGIVPSLKQPGSSSMPFDCESTFLRPKKAPRSRRNRSRSKQTKGELCLFDKTETDQVVPSLAEKVRWEEKSEVDCLLEWEVNTNGFS